jgi:AsmA-like C-terminal region
VSRTAVKVTLWIVAIIIALGIAASLILTYGYRGYVKNAVITVLQDRFHSNVQIKDMRVVIFPRIYVTASGVTIPYKDRTDIPPFLVIDKLEVAADFWSVVRAPRRVSSVHLVGLQIHVPPREPKPKEVPTTPKKPRLPVTIDSITCDDTTFVLLPKDPKKIPMQFDIHHLVMTEFRPDGPANFHATLRNPKPVGDIDTQGQFGPWEADEPSSTPVRGTYSFTHADLGTLKGIAGILSSQGAYDGVLDHLNVEGDTETPDFQLRTSAHPVDLKTHYVAVVDGTNGNTYLKSVVAKFRDSTIETSGEVVKNPDAGARGIILDATVTQGRVDDMLYLVVKSDKPVMTGGIKLTARINLPPRPGVDLFDRLILNGKFGVADAHFTSESVQGKIDSLSRRGQGEPKNEDIADVVSNLDGTFQLKDHLVDFSSLTFDVSGAKVDLAGSYDMNSEQLDFEGHLLLNAKLSQTTTGAKSVILKAFDPFFHKNGAGTSLPIKITGSRSSPSFGLDFHRKDDQGKDNDKKSKKDKDKDQKAKDQKAEKQKLKDADRSG